MFSSKKPSWQNILAALALALGLLVSTAIPLAHAQGNPNPGVIPVNREYEKLSAQWWQWANSFPVSNNPLFDQTGANACLGEQKPGNIFFLAGVINQSGAATRSITAPTGSRLFFPILNVEYDNLGTGPPLTVPQLRDAAAGYVNSTSELHATIDGVPMQNLFGYRVRSDAFCCSVPAADNLYQFFGLGDLLTGLACSDSFCVCPAVSDGYWMLLSPLSVGKHTINFGGTFTQPSPFSLDITYNIIVVPRGEYRGCQ